MLELPSYFCYFFQSTSLLPRINFLKSNPAAAVYFLRCFVFLSPPSPSFLFWKSMPASINAQKSPDNSTEYNFLNWILGLASFYYCARQPIYKECTEQLRNTFSFVVSGNCDRFICAFITCIGNSNHIYIQHKLWLEAGGKE